MKYGPDRKRTHWRGWGPTLGVALVLLLASGCGQKGPLYLPDEKPAPEQDAPPDLSG
jgi:Prokaryotic lipoprotein-attachment site